MSGILHPIGPEPPMVYWIRRAAIVVLVIVLLLALWWLVGSLRGGGASSAADPSDTVATSATPEASPDEGGDGGSGSDPTEAPSEQASEAAPVQCADSDIKVEATTDSSTYPVGSTPRLTLTITNTGDVACKRDVGPKANELIITSGGYHVWSSDDCNASNKSKMSTLKPDQPVASSITWSGHLSSPGCKNGEGAAAKAGTYRLTGRNGKVESDATPFSLTNPN